MKMIHFSPHNNTPTALLYYSKKYILLLLMFASVVNLPAQDTYALSTSYAPGMQMKQEKKQQKVNLKVKNERLSSVLEKIEKQIEYVFVYSDEVNASQRLSLDVRNADVAEVMQLISKQIAVEYEILNNKIILKPSKVQTPLAESGTTKDETVTDTKEMVTAIKKDIGLSGRVVTEGGNGLDAVSVTLKGTSIGTTTNAEGYFLLNIPDGQANGILVFSSVGFEPQEVNLSGRKNITVTLVAADKKLGEIVVIGYGTQRRGSVAGSVDVVGKKQLEGRPLTNMATALQGTAPNLIIQQRNFEPGQPVNINIRGISTLGNNTPLLVIDGIVIDDINAINLLNPSDVESVSVLKDAGTSAIFGSRAGNGVLIVTTKRGRKNEKTSVSYSGIYGTQQPRITYKPVDAWENAYYKNLSLANSGLSPAFTPQEIRDFQQRGNGDWRAENIVQNAPQQSHTITMSGGGVNNTYLLSLGFLDQKNNFIGPNYGYKRYNLRLNQSTEFGKFKVSTILSYVKVNNKDHAYNAATLMVDATRVPLYYSFTDTAGKYLTNPVSAQFNPKAILENGGYRTFNDDEIFGNLNVEYNIIKDLKIRGVFGGAVRSNTSYEQVIPLVFTPGGSWGDTRDVTDNNAKSLFTNSQLLLEYGKAIRDHDIKVLVAGSNESSIFEQSRVSRTRSNILGISTNDTLNFGNTFNTPASTVETSLNSVFGRAAYSYQSGKYYAEFSFRYDGSSKFAKGNRWSFFPSIAAHWKLTDEKFMKSYNDKIGDIKVRASYGLLGNQNVGAYQYQTRYQLTTGGASYAFGNTQIAGANYFLGNPPLTWEEVANLNLGFDANFLKRRLEVRFDYFNKVTSNILVRRGDVPQIFGVQFPPDANVAKVRNRGWDLNVSYTIPGKTFRHTFLVNLADNLNELLELTGGAKEIVEGREEFEFLRRIGQPITVYQGYKRNGYYQNLDDVKNSPRFANSTVGPGDVKYVDRNGDGVIDDQDKFILGNPFPRYTFGFTYTLAVKGFDVLVFLQGVGKRDQMIRGEQVEPFHFGYGGTMYAHQTDFWTPTNPNARWPRLAEAGSTANTNNYRKGSDIYLFDAAYARLKNIQVGYTLPYRITSKAGLNKARIYFTGQNLLTLTKLDFLDPEITEFDNGTSFNTGANSARAYFMPVFYGFGIDINF
jgi:TonB-dependent starch-binding outer membrane protein SusC